MSLSGIILRLASIFISTKSGLASMFIGAKYAPMMFRQRMTPTITSPASVGPSMIVYNARAHSVIKIADVVMMQYLLYLTFLFIVIGIYLAKVVILMSVCKSGGG